MKVQIQELPRYGRKLLFEIEAERVNAEKQRIIKDIQKRAEVPGFRKGKVPEQVIETRYNETITKQILEQIITESYIEAVKKYNLAPIIDPEVSDVRFDDTISFSVYVEVKPDVVVNKYKDIVVKKVEPEPVTDQMVQDVLSEREKRKEFASLIIDPEKRLAWEKQIRQQLEQLSAQIAQQKEQDQLWKQLFENSNVEIPEKLLLQRAQYLTQQQLRYIDTQNKTNEEIEKIAKKLFEEMKPIAEEQLKKYFILSKIAEMEKIEVSEEDVNREIERICLTSGEDFEKVKKQLIANDKLEDIKNDLKIDKALNLVKNNAQNIKKIILPGEEKNELRTQGQV